VIIPAYNEQKSIGQVIEQTEHVMKSMYVPYEIIVVDDGSTDKTAREAFAHRVTVVTYQKTGEKVTR
jgi:glycosyltransferase involved in cell wall biosynthesis